RPGARSGVGAVRVGATGGGLRPVGPGVVLRGRLRRERRRRRRCWRRSRLGGGPSGGRGGGRGGSDGGGGRLGAGRSGLPPSPSPSPSQLEPPPELVAVRRCRGVWATSSLAAGDVVGHGRRRGAWATS